MTGAVVATKDSNIGASMLHPGMRPAPPTTSSFRERVARLPMDPARACAHSFDLDRSRRRAAEWIVGASFDVRFGSSCDVRSQPWAEVGQLRSNSRRRGVSLRGKLVNLHNNGGSPCQTCPQTQPELTFPGIQEN